jgi:hypothetical protein
MLMEKNVASHERLCSSKTKVTPQIPKDGVTDGVTRDEVEQLVQNKIKGIKQVNNYNNISIIGTDMFRCLVDKMGENEAVRFINYCASIGNPMMIFEKLYLNGTPPECYPIAYYNGEYRFLNKDSTLIIDKTGSLIYELIICPIQNAVLQSVNHVINSQLESGELDSLYDIYNMRQMQTTILDMMTHKRDKTIKKLENLVKNKKHPFFVNDI